MNTTPEESSLNTSVARPLKVAVLSFAHTHAIGYCRALAGRPDIDLVVAEAAMQSLRTGWPVDIDLASASETSSAVPVGVGA